MYFKPNTDLAVKLGGSVHVDNHMEFFRITEAGLVDRIDSDGIDNKRYRRTRKVTLFYASKNDPKFAH